MESSIEKRIADRFLDKTGSSFHRKKLWKRIPSGEYTPPKPVSFGERGRIQVKDFAVGNLSKEDKRILGGYAERVNYSNWGRANIEDIIKDWKQFRALEVAMLTLKGNRLLGQYESYKERGVSFYGVYKSLEKLISIL